MLKSEADELKAAREGNVTVPSSLEETLRELPRVRAQLEGLLDGIHVHLEMLRSSLGAGAASASG